MSPLSPLQQRWPPPLPCPELGWAPGLSEDLGTKAGFEGETLAHQGLGLVTII